MDDLARLQLDVRLARRIARKKERLDQFRPFPDPLVQQLHTELRIHLSHHSTALEGNTLSLHETHMVIQYGLTVSGHTLHEHLEVTNHAAAVTTLLAVVRTGELMTLDTLLHLHLAVCDGIEPSAGRFRDGPVMITGAVITPPRARDVPQLLGEWLAFAHDTERVPDPIMRTAIAHHQLVAIHPFYNGNGRVARLVMNLMLMRNGYPPALLLANWRPSYLHALQTADTRGDYVPLATLLARAVEGGLDLYLTACEAIPEAEYQPLAELALATGIPADYLGWLIRHQHIAPAKKQRGRWYTTLAAVQRYQDEVRQGVYPRGRPRRHA